VKSRGRTLLLDTAGIDWIEAQGNYLALHAGAGVHLIRETLATLEGRLPQDFVRIHRGTIVNVARLRQIRPLQNGDASIRLTDGTELRMSRGYRDRLKARLPG
jgi:two-component system LytT family response regulator